MTLRPAVAAVVTLFAIPVMTLGRQGSLSQSSTGPCSPNVAGVSGNVNVLCGNDPRAFEDIVRRYLIAIQERDRAHDERRLMAERLSKQQNLSSKERLALEQTLRQREADLTLKVTQVKELAAQYRRLSDALAASEAEKARVLGILEVQERRSSSLAITAAAGIIGSLPAEQERAIALSLLALSEDESVETLTGAVRTLLSLDGPPLPYLADAGFCRDERRLVAIGSSNRLDLWDATTGRHLTATVAAEELATFMRPSLSNEIVTLATSGKLTVYDCSTLSALVTFDLPRASLSGRRLMSVSGDGSTLVESFVASEPAVASAPPSLRVWDLRRPGLLQELPLSDRLSALAISEDGTVVVSISSHASQRASVTVWKIGSAAPVRKYAVAGTVTDIMGSSGERILGVFDDRSWDVWDLTHGKRLLAFAKPKFDYRNPFLDQSVRLGFPDIVWHRFRDGLSLYQADRDKELFRVPTSGVDRASASADHRLVSWMENGVIRLVDLRTRPVLAMALPGGSVIGSLEFSRSGEGIVAATSRGLAAWSTTDGLSLWGRITPHLGVSAIGPSGATFETSRFSKAGDSPISVRSTIDYSHRWSVRSEAERTGNFFSPPMKLSRNGRFAVECVRVRCVVSDYPDSRVSTAYVMPFESTTAPLVADDGQSVLAFRREQVSIIGRQGSQISVSLPQDVTAVAATADLLSVAVAYADGSADIVDMTKESGRRRIISNDTTAMALDFSGDGKLLAIGIAGGLAAVVRTESAEPIGTFSLGGPTNTVRLSSDGRLLATASSSGAQHPGVVRVWRTTPPAMLLEWTTQGVTDLVFSEDQQSIILRAGDRLVHLPFTKPKVVGALCRLWVPPLAAASDEWTKKLIDLCYPAK